MNLNNINEFELKNIMINHDTILIVKKDEDQVFKMMEAQVCKLRNYYQDKFKYFIIDSEVARNVLKQCFNIFPQLVILKKSDVVASIRGFRKVEIPSKVIELNF